MKKCIKYIGQITVIIIILLHFSIFSLTLIRSSKTQDLTVFSFIYFTLFILTINFYVITSVKDPGFIPTQKPTQVLSIDPTSNDYTSPNLQSNINSLKTTQQSAKEKELEDENSGPIPITSFGQHPVISEPDEDPDHKENENPDFSKKTNSVYIETRACTVCLIEQPLRSKHCIECGRCVALYDHHCPWLGNCIGEKNRFYFWWYLLCEFLVLVMTISCLIPTIDIHEVWKVPFWLISFSLAICGLFQIMVGFLLGFHSYLACLNKSTWEVLSRKRISYMKGIPDGHNPFGMGIKKNLYFYCCLKVPAGYTMWAIS